MKNRIVLFLFLAGLTQGCCVFQEGSWDPLPCGKEQRESLKKEKAIKNAKLEQESKMNN